MSHTKEPWVVCRCSPSAFNVYHNDETVIGDEGLYSEVNSNAEDDAVRIVACVNACSGIPTEQLNRVISAHAAKVERLTGERDAAVRERDAAVEALRFYAEQHNFQFQSTCGHNVMLDHGEVARAALAKMEGGRG